MKKIIIIVAAVVVIAAAALFFFVLRPKGEPPEIRIECPTGEPFITNVYNSKHLLKSAIVLVVNDQKVVNVLTAENVTVRDTIIFILRDLTETDLGEPGTQDKLRNKIINALNSTLGIDNIVGVRFNDFVMN